MGLGGLYGKSQGGQGRWEVFQSTLAQLLAWSIKCFLLLRGLSSARCIET